MLPYVYLVGHMPTSGSEAGPQFGYMKTCRFPLRTFKTGPDITPKHSGDWVSGSRAHVHLVSQWVSTAAKGVKCETAPLFTNRLEAISNTMNGYSLVYNGICRFG